MSNENHDLALTAREKECLAYLAQGLRHREMAAKMGTTDRTVEKQVDSAKKKIGAKTREQAVAIAIVKQLL